MKVPLKNEKSAYQTPHFFPSHYDILSCKLLSVKLFTHCVPVSTFTTLHPLSTFTCFAKDFFSLQDFLRRADQHQEKV